MKLDKRITDIENIYNCFSDLTEIKETYVNTQGYFGWDLSDFANLDNCAYQKLVDVFDREEPFVSDEYSDDYMCYRYFLPEQFVKFPFKITDVIGEVLSYELQNDYCIITVKATDDFFTLSKKV